MTEAGHSVVGRRRYALGNHFALRLWIGAGENFRHRQVEGLAHSLHRLRLKRIFSVADTVFPAGTRRHLTCAVRSDGGKIQPTRGKARLFGIRRDVEKLVAFATNWNLCSVYAVGAAL